LSTPASSCPSTFRDEVEALARRDEFVERQHRHLRSEVGATDADVHHVGDGVVAADRLGVRQHRVERGVHVGQRGLVVCGHWNVGRRAQQEVHHRAIFGAIDRLAGEHRVAVRLQARLAGQRQQQRFGACIDQVLRQVGEDMGRGFAEGGEARITVGLEGGAQVEALAHLVVVRLQLLPGCGAVAANTGSRAHRTSCISFSSFTASAAKARMPSASFSVAIASSFSAKRRRPRRA
jgi:hypothetical protein